MIQEAIFTRAAAFAGLTAIIGTGPTRLYPTILPEKPTLDAVVYHEIAAPREAAMGADPGLVHARYQFDSWSTTRLGARDLAEQVRLCFERWRGTVGAVVVQDTFIDNEQDVAPELVDGVLLHRKISDFIIHYRE
jgi:hypothetical protein